MSWRMGKTQPSTQWKRKDVWKHMKWWNDWVNKKLCTWIGTNPIFYACVMRIGGHVKNDAKNECSCKLFEMFLLRQSTFLF
jgi:hypothetical protein